MAATPRSYARLQFRGDGLNPETVSAALGAKASVGGRGGEAFQGADGAWLGAAKTGHWSLVSEISEDDLEVSIARLFAGMTQDTALWQDLARQFSGRLAGYVQLSGSSRNGFRLDRDTLAGLAARGLHLDIIIEAIDT